MKKKRDCLLHGNVHNYSFVYLVTVWRSVIVICDTPQASFWVNEIMRRLARAVKLAIVSNLRFIRKDNFHAQLSWPWKKFYNLRARNYNNINWFVSSKTVGYLRTCKLCRFRSSYACAKNYPYLCSPFMHSAVSNESVSGQWMFLSDCADAQADLGLHCPHMPEDTFRIARPSYSLP